MFIVNSDLHSNGHSLTSTKDGHLEKILELITDNPGAINAIIIPGDITNHGYYHGYPIINSYWKLIEEIGLNHKLGIVEPEPDVPDELQYFIDHFLTPLRESGQDCDDDGDDDGDDDDDNKKNSAPAIYIGAGNHETYSGLFKPSIDYLKKHGKNGAASDLFYTFDLEESLQQDLTTNMTEVEIDETVDKTTSDNTISVVTSGNRLHFICCSIYPNRWIRLQLRTHLWWWSRQKGNRTRPIVIWFHYNMVGDYSDWWSQEDKNAFYRIIKDYNVVAIFNGHYHTSYTSNWRGIPLYGVGGAEFAVGHYDRFTGELNVQFYDQSGKTTVTELNVATDQVVSTSSSSLIPVDSKVKNKRRGTEI